MSYHRGFFNKDELEAQHEAVQEKLKKDPELAKKIKPLQDKVAAEIDAANEDLEQRRQQETMLREMMRDLFDDPSFNISDAERLVAYIQKLRKDNNAQKGQAMYFTFEGKFLTVTSMGTIEIVPKYVTKLESKVLYFNEACTILQNEVNIVRNMTFWTHIKLAFKKLFGGKNG